MRRLSDYPLLLLWCAALAASGFAQGTTPQPEPQDVAELQKLNGFFTFKRNRNDGCPGPIADRTRMKVGLDGFVKKVSEGVRPRRNQAFWTGF